MADKYLGIPLPTPTKNAVPSTDIRDHLFAGAKLDEEATSGQDIYIDRLGRAHLTNTGRNNKFAAELQAMVDRFNAFIERSGYQVIGDYEDGPLTITEYNQLVRYQNELWKITADTSIPFTTAGNTDASWEASDKVHFVSVGDGALRQNLGSGDGLKLIGRCPNLNALRSIQPEHNGQVIDVVSAGAQGFGGGRFVHIASMESPTYADDGGTIIAAGDKFWVREELVTGSTKIDVLWFGADNDYTSDSTLKIQAALDASAFWTQYASSAGRGVFNHRYKVVFPQRWSANKTIVYNPVFTDIDLNNGVGIFLNTGSYGTHPLDANYPVLLYMRCATPVNDLYIPAYGSFNIISNGTLLFGSLNSRGFPDAPTCYNTLPGTNHVMLAHHGINETLYTALGKISDVSIAGSGRAYMNGDYAWGTDFFNVKFINNGGMARLMSTKDSSEKIDFFGCFAANNGLGIEPAGWNGRVNWIGGSLDYFRSENPFKWVSNCAMQLNIDDTHIEFNPQATKCVFDLSSGNVRATLSLSRINMGYAIPSSTQGGGPVTGSLIKRNPASPEQLTLDNIRIFDASASGAFTKNYLIVNDDGNPIKMKGMNPITIKDYFVNSSLVNRRTTAKWQHYFVNSSAFDVSYSSDSVTITGTVGAIAQDKSVCLFIPAQEIRSETQFILGLIKCLSCSVTSSFALYTAYSKSNSAGLVNSSDVVTISPIGVEHLVSLQVGVNTNVVSYGSGSNAYTLASWSKASPTAPAEGLMVRLWLFNFVEGSTLTLSCNSGLVTL
ncbi:TPA: hypothetical protein ACXE8V_001056 [Pluralibacter gergoviae]